MPQNTYLTEIAEDYQSAEITCLLLQNRHTKDYYNLLTLVELVPYEQPASPLIGTSNTSYSDRESVDKDYTLFIARAVNLPVMHGIDVFKNAEQGFQLAYGDVLNAAVKQLPQTKLINEPLGEYPLLISDRQEETIGNLLPHRSTGFRVWCKIDMKKAFLHSIDKNYKKKIFQKAGKLTARHLNFNFSELQQHAGHTYLFGCNPLIRYHESSLLDYATDLLIRFRERVGKSLVGTKMILKDKRAENYGFHIEVQIAHRFQQITLPNFPNALETTLFDHRGYALECHTGVWTNFELQTSIHQAVLNLNVQEGNETRTERINKYSNVGSSTMGSYDHTGARFLKDSVRNKEIERLEKDSEFVFFPGSGEDKKKARFIIGRILNKANQRCILLDPYFGASDLYYAYQISNLSVPVQLISSAAFLESGQNATALQNEIEKFKESIPNQKIECRVLKSKRGKSPLHDRYIIADNAAYLLGSSFNEFGTRATTLIKVPVPETLIEKALDWWQAEKHSEPLSNFINRKATNDEVAGST